MKSKQFNDLVLNKAMSKNHKNKAMNIVEAIQDLGKQLGLPDEVLSNVLKDDESLPGKRGEPLAVGDLFNMKVGDKVWIYWAKDDDPDDVRLNGVYQIEFNDGYTMEAPDCYEWSKDEICRNENTNVLDTSRGYAYFYKVIE